MLPPILRLSLDIANLIRHPTGIPVKYYTAEPNVGDLLNPYLIPQITGLPIFKSRTHRFNHLTAIGSLLEGVGPKSFVWGSGSMTGADPRRPITRKNIFALRGKMSLELIEKFLKERIEVPLGDPALLMPCFFNPEVEKEFDFGIIPHHSEKDTLGRAMEIAPPGTKIIDVGLDPENFVRDLKKCKAVFSSSLHGLILADAYDVPNVWIRLTDRIVGGEWKFRDYYSVTTRLNPERIDARNTGNFIENITKLVGAAQVNKYTGNADLLLEAFPGIYRK